MDSQENNPAFHLVKPTRKSKAVLIKELNAIGKDEKSLKGDILNDAIDLTTFWNNMGPLHARTATKKAPVNPLSRTRPVSIAQCRSIARDDTKSVTSMVNYISNVPEEKLTPFAPKKRTRSPNRAESAVKTRSIRPEEDLFIFNNEFSGSSEEEEKVKYKSSKATDSLFALKEKISPIKFKSRYKFPSSERKFTIKNLADEIKDNGKGYLLEPVVLTPPSDTIITTTTKKTIIPYNQPINPKDVFRLTHSESAERYLSLLSSDSDPLFDQNLEEIYNNIRLSDANNSDDNLRLEATAKFMELFPEQIDDDDAMDKWIEEYVEAHRKH